MFEFWLSFGVFLLSHSVVSRKHIRAYCTKKLGERFYLIVYSTLSLLLLGWLIAAAQNAPRIELWQWHSWYYWFPNIVMPFACILLVAGFIVPNPMSIAPKATGFDPQRPGLVIAITHHPILWGFFLWSVSHIAPNGEYPLAIMFSGFALFSLAGIVIIDKKRKRELGSDTWHYYTKNTHAIPFCSSSIKSMNIRVTRKDILGIVLGLVLYGALFHAHKHIFGIAPNLW